MGPVVVLGASNNPNRYSYQAMQLLREKGFKRVPVNPKEQEIDGEQVFSHLSELRALGVHTVTVYLNPLLSDPMEADLVALKPQRVIFNPGSENPRLANILRAQGIDVWEACTLVLLRTSQF